MATIVGSVAGGNWNTNGAWVGSVQPTAADDVQLTATSGAIAFVGTPVCRSLDCNGYLGTLSGSAAVSIGDGTAGAGNIALRLVGTMNYTATSTISFISTSATVQSITTAGKALANLTFNGVAGSWQFADGYTNTASIHTLTNGTIDYNGQTFSLSTLNSLNANTRTLTFGAANITLGVAGQAFNTSTQTNLVVTANTATMTLTGAGSTFLSGSGVNFNGLSVSLTGSGSCQLNATGCTFGNISRIGTAAKGEQLLIRDITWTGVFTVTGQSAVNRVYLASNVEGSTRTLAGGATGTTAFTNVDFRDITMTGTNSPFGGTSMGDALHNSGITFDAPTTQNHDGTTSNASTAARWTSRVPLPQDTVTCTSGSGTITFDMPRIGADVDFTGFTGTASFASVATTLYGSLKFATGMTVSGTLGLTFAARSAKTITSNGKAFTMTVTIGASSGTITLADALSGTSITMAGVSSTFDASTFGLTLTGVFTGLAGTTVNMGSGTWTMSGTGTVFTLATATLNAQTSTLAITDTSSTNKTVAIGAARTFNVITISPTGTGIVILGTGTSAWTIGTLNLTGGLKNLRFFAATTYTISTWNVSGIAANLVTIDTTTAGTAATLTKTGGIVSSDYLSLKDSTATGGAAWFAGANSTNVSGNTGWVFTAVPVAKGGTLAMMGV